MGIVTVVLDAIKKSRSVKKRDTYQMVQRKFRMICVAKCQGRVGVALVASFFTSTVEPLDDNLSLRRSLQMEETENYIVNVHPGLIFFLPCYRII